MNADEYSDAAAEHVRGVVALGVGWGDGMSTGGDDGQHGGGASLLPTVVPAGYRNRPRRHRQAASTPRPGPGRRGPFRSSGGDRHGAPSGRGRRRHGSAGPPLPSVVLPGRGPAGRLRAGRAAAGRGVPARPTRAVRSSSRSTG